MASSALPTHEMKIYVSLKGFSVIYVVAYSLVKCLYALFFFFFFFFTKCASTEHCVVVDWHNANIPEFL